MKVLSLYQNKRIRSKNLKRPTVFLSYKLHEKNIHSYFKNIGSQPDRLCGSHFIFLSFFPSKGKFHKAIYALCLKFALCAHPFEQIHSNSSSCSYHLHSTSCIFSQIWVPSMLYAVHPTFMKSTPRQGQQVKKTLLDNWIEEIFPLLSPFHQCLFHLFWRWKIYVNNKPDRHI
jgi:hypothetical protein